MERDQDQQVVFSRRAFVAGIGVTGLMAVLGSRLAWLQLMQGDVYKTQAEQNRINLKMLTPPRGQIVDRFGVPLAINVQDFRVLLIPERVDNVEQALSRINKYVPIDEKQVATILRQAKTSPRFMPLQVRNNLSWDQVSAVEFNMPDLPGVMVEDGEIRNYPYREATAHVIGYVGRVSEKDIEANEKDAMLKLPGLQIGKNGIEKSYDQILRGSPGKSETEVNVHGRQVRQLSVDPPTSGERLMISIDAELQRYVQQRLSLDRSGSAIIMDVHTGAVYALASHPGFDPNVFARGVTAPEWEELLSDETKPLNNKAISGLYPPGSTFKMITALAGLEAGLINQHSSVSCPGHYDYGNTRFHCWKKGGHGSVNLGKALAESCDTYFYKLSTQLGVDRIAEMSRRFGLGTKLDIELPEEKAGLVPDVAWKKKARSEPWHPGETIVASIGQGYIQTTPLQLTTMVSRLVNGGVAVKPWIADHIGDGAVKHPEWKSLDIKPANLAIIREGMDHVLMPGGTAWSSRITEPGMEMGGKTGTSQVKRISKAERAAGISQNDLPWHLRHHALFVGYAPLHAPRYACCVVVEHGGGGSSAAAPIARDIMLEVQRRNPANVKLTPVATPEDQGQKP